MRLSLAGILSITLAESAEGDMDASNLTWRDKLAIIDTTARIAARMFLMMAAFRAAHRRERLICPRRRAQLAT